MTKSIQVILSLLIAMPSSIAILFFFQPIRSTSLFLIVLFTMILSIVYYSLFSGFVHRRLRSLNSVQMNLIYIFTFLYSIALLFSIKGEQGFLADNHFLVKLFVYVGFFCTVYLATLLIISILLNLDIKNNQIQNTNRKNILLYAVPSILVWSVYLIAFYPAAMTPDSLSQWAQAHNGKFWDWHPVVSTWFIMFLNLFWDSPAIIGVAQILILGLVIGYGLYCFEKFGLHKWIVWIVALAFAVIPINGIFAITVWKDILYSVFLLFLCIIIFNIVMTKGKWLTFKSSLLLYFIGAIGVSFFRHNGFPIFVVMSVFMLIIYRKHFKPLFFVSALVIVLHFFITGPVFKYLDVIPSDPNEALGIPTQQMGMVITNNGELTKSQTAYLNKILPIERWKEEFDPYNTNPIKFSDEYNREAIGNDRGTYFRTWAEIGLQNPSLYIKGYLKQTSIVWQINEPVDGYTDTFVTNIYPNDYGIQNETISTRISYFIKKWLIFTDTTLSQIIWRPANYLFFVLLMTFVAAIKINWRVILVMFPVFLNVGTILAGIPAQDFRYMYPVVLLSFLASMLPFVKNPWGKEKNLE